MHERAVPPESGASCEPRPRLFTVDEFYRMAETGVLRPDERLELIDGELVQMPPIGPGHWWSVRDFAEKLTLLLTGRAYIVVQSPVRLSDRRQPEPDVVVIRLQASREAIPGPEDVLLLVEYADSSLSYDRDVKARLYAEHGIRDFWLADLAGGRLEIRREPGPDGYRWVRVLERGSRVRPLALDHVDLLVDDVLGPAQ